LHDGNGGIVAELITFGEQISAAAKQNLAKVHWQTSSQGRIPS
jgi:hypothetical protein